MLARCWIDGRLAPADAPLLTVTDRGFQLGDGLFETLRARRGTLVEWAEHLERLRHGAAVLGIVPPSGERIAAGIRELLAAESLAGAGEDGGPPGDAAVRITVTRGPLAARGTLPPDRTDDHPTIVIQCWPYAPPPSAHLTAGVRAVVSALRRDPGSPLSGVKTTSRADSVYAKLEAERAGADDALFLTLDGRLSEATSSNLFLVHGDRLLTPPLTAAVLAGTTRTWLLEDAAVAALGLRPAAVDLTPDDLAAAEEAFLSSSVAGIVPLSVVDGRPVGPGRPGPRTLALRAARERWIDETTLAGRVGPADERR